MPRRRYSDDDRANALAALAANGGNLSKTAAELGIPRKTIAAWATGQRHPEAGENAPAKKRDMADALEAIAWKLADAIPGKIDKAPLTATATSLGIAIDKMRLLRNQPTTINRDELEDLSSDDLDARIVDLEKRLSQAQGTETKATGP